MHIPPLSHAVDLQMHANIGSLWAASEPLHPVQVVALLHPVQLLLQAKFYKKYFYIIKIKSKLNKFK